MRFSPERLNDLHLTPDDLVLAPEVTANLATSKGLGTYIEAATAVCDRYLNIVQANQDNRPLDIKQLRRDIIGVWSRVTDTSLFFEVLSAEIATAVLETQRQPNRAVSKKLAAFSDSFTTTQAIIRPVKQLADAIYDHDYPQATQDETPTARTEIEVYRPTLTQRLLMRWQMLMHPEAPTMSRSQMATNALMAATYFAIPAEMAIDAINDSKPHQNQDSTVDDLDQILTAAIKYDKQQRLSSDNTNRQNQQRRQPSNETLMAEAVRDILSFAQSTDLYALESALRQQAINRGLDVSQIPTIEAIVRQLQHQDGGTRPFPDEDPSNPAEPLTVRRIGEGFPVRGTTQQSDPRSARLHEIITQIAPTPATQADLTKLTTHHQTPGDSPQHQVAGHLNFTEDETLLPQNGLRVSQFPMITVTPADHEALADEQGGTNVARSYYMPGEFDYFGLPQDSQLRSNLDALISSRGFQRDMVTYGYVDLNVITPDGYGFILARFTDRNGRIMRAASIDQAGNYRALTIRPGYVELILEVDADFAANVATQTGGQIILTPGMAILAEFQPPTTEFPNGLITAMSSPDGAIVFYGTNETTTPTNNSNPTPEPNPTMVATPNQGISLVGYSPNEGHPNPDADVPVDATTVLAEIVAANPGWAFELTDGVVLDMSAEVFVNKVRADGVTRYEFYNGQQGMDAIRLAMNNVINYQLARNGTDTTVDAFNLATGEIMEVEVSSGSVPQVIIEFRDIQLLDTDIINSGTSTPKNDILDACAFNDDNRRIQRLRTYDSTNGVIREIVYLPSNADGTGIQIVARTAQALSHALSSGNNNHLAADGTTPTEFLQPISDRGKDNIGGIISDYELEVRGLN